MQRLTVVIALVVAVAATAVWVTVAQSPEDDEEQAIGQSQQADAATSEQPESSESSDDQRPMGEHADAADQAEQPDEAVEQVESAEASEDAVPEPGPDDPSDVVEDEPVVVVVDVESQPTDPADLLIRLFGLELRDIAVTGGAAEEYAIQPGDTLTLIAHRHELSVAALLEANPGIEPTDLRIGAAIRISRDSANAFEIAPGALDNGIVFGTITDRERDLIHSLVATPSLPVQGSEPGHWFTIGCMADALAVEWHRFDLTGNHVDDLSAEAARVYWQVDAGPLRSSRWIVSAAGALAAPLPAAVVADLENGEQLTLRLASESGDPRRFSLVGLLSAPTQANLHHCGR